MAKSKDVSGKPKSSGFLGEIFDTVKTFVIALTLAMIVRSLLFQPFNIPSGSMIPTLEVGDFIFTTKYTYGYSEYSFPFGVIPLDGRLFGRTPERGEVAVFRQPTNTSVDFIKRVVGLPGDRVQMIGGVLHLNGEAVPREQIGTFTFEARGPRVMQMNRYRETLPNGVSYEIIEASDFGPLDNTQEYVVPEGHYFMMGDNRDFSQDSRVLSAVGYVPLENFVGPASIIWFSIGDGASFWQIWRWPTSLRFERFFQWVQA